MYTIYKYLSHNLVLSKCFRMMTTISVLIFYKDREVNYFLLEELGPGLGAVPGLGAALPGRGEIIDSLMPYALMILSQSYMHMFIIT